MIFIISSYNIIFKLFLFFYRVKATQGGGQGSSGGQANGGDGGASQKLGASKVVHPRNEPDSGCRDSGCSGGSDSEREPEPRASAFWIWSNPWPAVLGLLAFRAAYVAILIVGIVLALACLRVRKRSRSQVPWKEQAEQVQTSPL